MAGSALQTAQDLYTYAIGDAAKIAEVTAAFDAAMASGPLTKGGLSDVTAATKNGVSYQKTIGLSERDRITALRIAKTCLAAETYPSARSYARFC